MIRLLIFILTAIFLAGAVTFLLSVDGMIEAEAFGKKISVHAGFALGAMAFLFIAGLYLTAWAKDAAALPEKIRAREREARRARGVAALARGLEAVAAGDAVEAQHQARIARRNLEEPSLTRLLTAQAALLAGDEAGAKETFNLMLEAPETEFLGVRGLYLQAVRAGDREAASMHAERAFQLRPGADWAAQAVIEYGLERGAWRRTRETLAAARKAGSVAPEKARRGEAALLAAEAHAAALSGADDVALGEAEAALKIAPGLTPAALLAARLEAAVGRRPKAARILEQAFAESPHPALVEAHSALYTDGTVEQRAARLKRIADRRPTAREAKIALVRRHLLLGEHEEAIATLEPLLMETAWAGDYALMAEAAAAGKEGPAADAAARPWLRRAAASRRDPTPGADGSFNLTREGWARLVREYMEHGRLAPPPLEDAPPGLSRDEARLLLAPPAPAEEAPVEPAASSTPEDAGAGEANTGGEGKPDDEHAGARAVAATGEVS